MEVFFDKQKLEGLMTAFNVLTHIKIVIYDVNFQVVLSVPSEDCRLCSAIRTHSQAKVRCDHCAVEAGMLCKMISSVNIYQCHAGLTGAVAPLKINDVIVGYLMMGQILDEESMQIQHSQLMEYVAEYCGTNIHSFFDSDMIKSQQQVRAAAKFLETCVSYIRMNHLIQSNHGGLPFKIADYIENHLSDDLSTKVLCRNFNISRNMLYKLSASYLGMPIAKYIRKKRIAVSLELLKKGFPVAEVAMRTGFSDYSYFTKTFKRETGNLPSKMTGK